MKRIKLHFFPSDGIVFGTELLPVQACENYVFPRKPCENTIIFIVNYKQSNYLGIYIFFARQPPPSGPGPFHTRGF